MSFRVVPFILDEGHGCWGRDEVGTMPSVESTVLMSSGVSGSGIKPVPLEGAGRGGAAVSGFFTGLEGSICWVCGSCWARGSLEELLVSF